METSVVRQEAPKEHIVLIVDKENVYGEELASRVEEHATTVLVSEQKGTATSIIYIPFTKRVPVIPEGVYSHIFLFSEEEAEHELLKPLAEKANQDNAKLIYSLPYWLYTPEITDKLASLCKRWVLVLLGDVFDSKTVSSHIGQIFEQGKKHKKISLPDLGLEAVRPIAYEDVVNIMLHVGFGLEREHVCFAFSKHPYTALSLVHLLQKNDPLLRIDFVSQDTPPKNPLLPEGIYLVDSDYPAMKKAQEAYERFELSAHRRQEKASVVVSKKADKEISWRLPVISLVVGVLFFIALPFLWTYTTLFLGDVLFARAQQEIGRRDFNQTIVDALASSTLYDYSHVGSLLLLQEAGMVGQGEKATILPQQTQSKKALAQVLVLGSQAASDFSVVLQGKTLTPQATFTQAVNETKNTLLTLGSINTQYIPASLQKEFVALQPLVAFGGQLLDVLPHILGIDSPKTYAILLQDNTELRPGGGVVVVYALVTLQNGKLGKLQIHNVYEADDELKGHVEPPFAIRRYLQQAHWYLRDSNFAIDGVKNAQNAAFFLQQETATRVDGVLAVDMSFMKAVVDSLGSVSLPEYNETLTQDNFSQIVASHAQRSTYDPTSQKKDFSSSLLRGISAKIEKDQENSLGLFKVLFAALEQKHALVAFSDAGIQQLFTINNMSNSSWDSRVQGENNVNDSTGVNEANVGVNKVNAFVTRMIKQDVTIDPAGTISAVLTLHYQNDHTNAWPGGPYANYLRFVLPQGATITNISLNAVPQSRFPAVVDPKLYETKTFKAPKGIEIEHTQEGGREVYGFLVTVPAAGSLDVALSYALAQKLDTTAQAATFDELLLKQPGSNADNYTYSLSYPQNWTLVQKPKGAKTNAQTVTVATPLATDVDYQFVFSR